MQKAASRISKFEFFPEKINSLIEGLLFQNINDVMNGIVDIIEKTNAYLLLREAHVEEYRLRDTQELEVHKKELENELNELDLIDTNERLKGSFVIGATLDTFIGRFQEGNPNLTHIFVDEAGYVPLIKALVLFQKNVKVTLTVLFGIGIKKVGF